MIGITGGGGFLGSHLMDALASTGKQIRVLDGMMDCPGRSIVRRRRRLLKWANVDFIEGDLRDPKALNAFLVGLDHVYHFARTPGDHSWFTDPRGAFNRDVQGMDALLDGMSDKGINHLILRSDASVYGETPPGGAKPNTPFAPRNRAGSCAVTLEALASNWLAGGRRQLTILRPFLVYGPRMGSDNLVYRLLVAALEDRPVILPGDGAVTRDLLFASDMIRMTVQARRVRSADQAAIFVQGTGRPTSLLELVAAVRRVTGKVLRVDVGPLSRDQPCQRVSAPADSAKQLRVKAETQLDEGLALTYAWLRRVRR